MLQKRFPFDSNTPFGYLLADIIEYIVLCYAYLIIACTLALGIGVFCFAISVTKDIQRILHLVNDTAKANTNQSNELKLLLAEFNDVHAATKQLSNKTPRYYLS